MPARPPGFIHVDLDGLWTLAGCYGFPEGDLFKNDPVFERALPRLIGLFDELGVRATFFIVGRDLEDAAKAGAVAELARRGHELANHGYRHQFGLERAPEEVLQDEIEQTNAAIERVSGRRPVGFRAPGYTAGPRVLAACARAGIRYDGSRLPTCAGPLLRRAAGRMRAQVRRELLSPESGVRSPEGRMRAVAGAVLVQEGVDLQYGGGGGLAPEWFSAPEGGGALLRLPLAVSPWLRLPIHASVGSLLGERFVSGALKRLARRSLPITYLVHGMDLAAPEELAGRIPVPLARTRPMAAPLGEKMDFLKRVLETLGEATEIQLTREWIERQAFE